jgi:hypothetical protein
VPNLFKHHSSQEDQGVSRPICEKGVINNELNNYLFISYIRVMLPLISKLLEEIL